MRVALWAWHCPYIFNLARALPEVEWLVLPTQYNPTGWDETQRPQPENVRLESTWAEADVVITQTPTDLANLFIAPDDLPIVYLSHNHWVMDGTAPERVARLCRRLVCISEMKALSWRENGQYHDEIEVIPPGIDPAEYADGRWTGRGGYVLTVCNAIRRPLFDLPEWRRVTEGVPIRLVGSYNQRIPGAEGPVPSWDALKALYRGCAYYLNPTSPPFEDAWNLAALEAAACGAPVVNLHGTAPRVEDFPIEAFRERWRRLLAEVAK